MCRANPCIQRLQIDMQIAATRQHAAWSRPSPALAPNFDAQPTSHDAKHARSQLKHARSGHVPRRGAGVELRRALPGYVDVLTDKRCSRATTKGVGASRLGTNGHKSRPCLPQRLLLDRGLPWKTAI
jgi:hypothetical protein